MGRFSKGWTRASNTITELNYTLLEHIERAETFVTARDLLLSAITYNEETQAACIRYIAQRWLYPSIVLREIQVECIRHILFGERRDAVNSASTARKRDLVLSARTGFGKSVILQATTLLKRRAISICIIPLDRIGQEQYAKIKAMPEANPIFLNGSNIDEPGLLDFIRDGTYTHILLSPELAVGKFQEITRTPDFKARLLFIAIDELHLVHHWGKGGEGFRQEYARLRVLRGRVGNSIPLFGCSATLDKQTLEKALYYGGFQGGDATRIIRTSVDRPDITLILQPIPEKTYQSFTALGFIMDDAVDVDEQPTLYNIPKTIIFLDSRSEVLRLRNELRSWFGALFQDKRVLQLEIAELVTCYFSNTAGRDKEDIYSRFNDRASLLRIIVATEALGAGVDLTSVTRVIQYGLPQDQSLTTLWQRFGRAARASDQTGEAIFLYQSWTVGERARRQRGKVAAYWPRNHISSQAATGLSAVTLAEDADSGAESAHTDHRNDSRPFESLPVDTELIDKSGARKSKSKAERRLEMSFGMWSLINEACCTRKAFLEFFENPTPSLKDDAVEKAYCCLYCNHLLRKQTWIPDRCIAAVRTCKRPRAGTDQAKGLQRLEHWCTTQILQLEPNTFCDIPPDVMLSLQQRVDLIDAVWKSGPVTIDTIRREIPDDWEWKDTCEARLLEELIKISLEFVYTGWRLEIPAMRERRNAYLPGEAFQRDFSDVKVDNHYKEARAWLKGWIECPPPLRHPQRMRPNNVELRAISDSQSRLSQSSELRQPPFQFSSSPLRRVRRSATARLNLEPQQPLPYLTPSRDIELSSISEDVNSQLSPCSKTRTAARRKRSSSGSREDVQGDFSRQEPFSALPVPPLRTPLQAISLNLVQKVQEKRQESNRTRRPNRGIKPARYI